MNEKIKNFQAENTLLQNIALKQDSMEMTPCFIALDEVGRGCVAGPVLSCASLWIHKKYVSEIVKKQLWLPLIDDSKKLSEKKRNICFDLILNEYDLNIANIPFSNQNPTTPFELNESNSKLHFHADTFLNLKQQNSKNSQSDFECISFSLGEASASEIDDFNIWNAVQLACARSLVNLKKNSFYCYPPLHHAIENAFLLMDGKHFIKVPNGFEKNTQITVTQADGIFVSVGFSSILAKVFRDTFMAKQDSFFPLFDFSRHKGYGTAKHLSLIKKIGTCSLHRKSFLTHYCPQNLF